MLGELQEFEEPEERNPREVFLRKKYSSPTEIKLDDEDTLKYLYGDPLLPWTPDFVDKESTIDEIRAGRQTTPINKNATFQPSQPIGSPRPSPRPSPSVSPRPSPKVSPRPSPKVSPRPSPKISPRLSPRPSPRISSKPIPQVYSQPKIKHSIPILDDEEVHRLGLPTSGPIRKLTRVLNKPIPVLSDEEVALLISQGIMPPAKSTLYQAPKSPGKSSPPVQVFPVKSPKKPSPRLSPLTKPSPRSKASPLVRHVLSKLKSVETKPIQATEVVPEPTKSIPEPIPEPTKSIPEPVKSKRGRPKGKTAVSKTSSKVKAVKSKITRIKERLHLTDSKRSDKPIMPKVTVPLFSTALKPVSTTPIKIPAVLGKKGFEVEKTKGPLIVESSQHEDKLAVLKEIDLGRLITSGRPKKVANPYTFREVRDFAKRLGLEYKKKKEAQEDIFKLGQKMGVW
jgi:hypothetical protein